MIGDAICRCRVCLLGRLIGVAGEATLAANIDASRVCCCAVSSRQDGPHRTSEKCPRSRHHSTASAERPTDCVGADCIADFEGASGPRQPAEGRYRFHAFRPRYHQRLPEEPCHRRFSWRQSIAEFEPGERLVSYSYRFLRRAGGLRNRGHLNGDANRAMSPARIGVVLHIAGGSL